MVCTILEFRWCDYNSPYELLKLLNLQIFASTSLRKALWIGLDWSSFWTAHNSLSMAYVSGPQKFLSLTGGKSSTGWDFAEQYLHSLFTNCFGKGWAKNCSSFACIITMRFSSRFLPCLKSGDRAHMGSWSKTLERCSLLLARECSICMYRPP